MLTDDEITAMAHRCGVQDRMTTLSELETRAIITMGIAVAARNWDDAEQSLRDIIALDGHRRAVQEAKSSSKEAADAVARSVVRFEPDPF